MAAFDCVAEFGLHLTGARRVVKPVREDAAPEHHRNRGFGTTEKSESAVANKDPGLWLTAAS